MIKEIVAWKTSNGKVFERQDAAYAEEGKRKQENSLQGYFEDHTNFAEETISELVGYIMREANLLVEALKGDY